MRRFSIAICSAVLCLPASPSFASVFVDVSEGVPYVQAVVKLKADGVIGGYADGSFRPYRTLIRAEFVKILTAVKLDPAGEKCKTVDAAPFIDVPKDAWFAKSACVAKEAGVVTGFADGSFGPANAVTLGEAAKMLSVAFGGAETKGDPWYRPYISFLGGYNAIPPTLGHPEQYITRGEAVEMLWRLTEGKTDLPCANVDAVLSATCERIGTDIPGVDIQEVERTWLQWINDARAKEGLAPYAIDRQLTRTAILWSQRSAAQGSITHKRAGQTAYYDYGRMVDWFDDLGLEFQNVNRVTFTENIGYGYYKCRSNDCTGDFIAGVRSTFDFFMSEKGKAYRPHYNSIMNPSFKGIGIGLAADGGKYYITTHYGTEITSEPAPVCL